MERTYFLPWPISTNAIWRAVNGRNILSEAVRKWFERAGEELMLQRPKAVKGPVELEVKLGAPNKRSYDPDNKCKVLFDALVKNGIIEDDSDRVIKRYSVSVLPIEAPGGALVTVSPLSNEKGAA